MLWQSYLECILHKILQAADGVDDKETFASEVGKILDLDGVFGQPFNGLQTRYQQVKYYKKKFGLLVS